jgi:hypothetical protein
MNPTKYDEKYVKYKPVKTYYTVPWSQNPQVHHRIDNSLPPAPNLSQLDPIYVDKN